MFDQIKYRFYEFMSDSYRAKCERYNYEIKLQQAELEKLERKLHKTVIARENVLNRMEELKGLSN